MAGSRCSFLRANLKTILLNVTALDACVERFGYDPDAMLIQEAARYLDAMRELHKAGSVLLRASTARWRRSSQASARAGLHATPAPSHPLLTHRESRSLIS